MVQLNQEEFRQRFGILTERRVELYERFLEWESIAQSTGALRRVWVFGSFLTEKPGPGDLDVLAVFAEDFDPSHLPPESRNWFDHELCREVNEIDLFFFT